MNVTRITGFNIYFKGKIIDSHAHIGYHNRENNTKEQLDTFVKSALPNKDTVEKMIVSDLDVLHSVKGEYEGNKAALELFKNNDKYALLASCSPKDGDVKNIEKLFKEHPNEFKGLKFHPDIQKLPISDKKYEPYMKFASKNNLPCLFHSQVNVLEGKLNPNDIHITDPTHIYNLAKKHPKIPVVLAHMGAGWQESHDKAIDILVESIKKGDANLYADVSWVDIDNAQTHIVKAIKRLKGIGEKDWKYGDQSYRLMFGTDAPLARFQGEGDVRTTYSNFVDKIKTSIRNDKDLQPEAEKIIEDLFYNNAKKLYLSDKKKVSGSKDKIIIGSIIAALTLFCGYAIYKTRQHQGE